jgi:hypothetical protein
MTDRSKFEQMLEHLINEEQDKAKELFHELVVEKSRQIYENILSDSFGDDEDEFGKDDEFGDDEDHDVGGDPADDFIDDMGSDEGDEDFGGDDSDEDLEDRVVDLEDALKDLQAEFEALMDQESGEDEHDGEDFGDDIDSDQDDEFGSDDDMGDEDFGSDDEMGDEDFADLKKESFFREYVETFESSKKTAGLKPVKVPTGGDKGANTKSPVAKPNRMGGSSANILRGDEETKGGTKGGLANPSVSEEDFGNVNKPGANAGKTAFKKPEAGHGPEKKGTGDKAANTRSVVGASTRKR